MRYFFILILSILLIGCHKEFKDAKTQEEKNLFFTPEEAEELIGFNLPPYDVKMYHTGLWGGGEEKVVRLFFRNDNQFESTKERREYIISEFRKNHAGFDSIFVPGNNNMYGYKDGYELYLETNGGVCFIRKLPFNNKKKS